MKIKFNKLYVGDRFYTYYNSQKSLWTKISWDTARKHSENSIALLNNSYGYIGDTIASFEEDEIIEFAPVELKE